jgi:hypothetical protein
MPDEIQMQIPRLRKQKTFAALGMTTMQVGSARRARHMKRDPLSRRKALRSLGMTREKRNWGAEIFGIAFGHRKSHNLSG